MQAYGIAKDADIETLAHLNGGYIRSVQHSDVRWFESNLAEDFLSSNPDGSLVDRAGFLEQIARPATISDLEARDVRIRIMGEVAIIHGATIYAKANGQRRRAATPTYGRTEQGRWLCVAAHVTRE
jgi:ketosteroid isomerase-like protein